MEVKCSICGKSFEVAKWQQDFERIREHGEEPFVCEPCQDRVRREAQSQASIPR